MNPSLSAARAGASSLAETALLALAIARATRFVTTDKLGAWTIREPLYDWALHHENENMLATLSDDGPVFRPPGYKTEQEQWGALGAKEKVEHIAWAKYLRRGQQWRSRLVSGLTCPFCVGFWIGLAGLFLTLLPLPRSLAVLRRTLIGAFALNYVTGHLNSKID